MAVKRWNGTSWEIYAGSDLAPVKVTDGRVGKTTFIGATTPTGMVDGDIWIDQDTATNAVVPTALLAKGDIFVATGNGAYTRLAAGNNGESLYADSSTSTGLRWQSDVNTGKNKFLNGDFSIWQRGTSSNANGFLADRWYLNNGAATSFSQSRQAFTPGSAPVAGYEGKYFWRNTITNIGSETGWYLNSYIEDVQTLAGQTVTFSFWGKSDSSRSISGYFLQRFGTGGSPDVSISLGSFTLTTTWQRFTATVSLPSLAGKTIGTNNLLQFFFAMTPASGTTIDLWGFQLEAGSIATPFTTNTGNPQAELAACQRYYNRWTAANGGSAYAFIHAVWAYSTTQAFGLYTYPVPMRVTPSLETTGTASNYRVVVGNSFITCSGVPALDQANPYTMNIQYPVSSGLTVGQAGVCGPNNNNIAYLGFSAEL